MVGEGVLEERTLQRKTIGPFSVSMHSCHAQISS